MNPKERPSCRSSEHEGKPILNVGKITPAQKSRKPFDAVEQKLSAALDAIVDVIETYRELHR